MRVTSALHVTMRLSEAQCSVSYGVSMRKMYVGWVSRVDGAETKPKLSMKLYSLNLNHCLPRPSQRPVAPVTD